MKMTCTFDYHQENKWPVYDRYGIFYTYVCPKCASRLSPEQRAHLADYTPEEPLDD